MSGCIEQSDIVTVRIYFKDTNATSVAKRGKTNSYHNGSAVYI